MINEVLCGGRQGCGASLRAGDRLGGAGLAEEDEAIAGFEGAVFVVAGFGVAAGAIADVFCFIAKSQVHAAVEDVALAFPMADVAELLAILYDAAVEVVDVLETL